MIKRSFFLCLHESDLYTLLIIFLLLNVRLANEQECNIENYHTSAEGMSDYNFRYYMTYEFANCISNRLKYSIGKQAIRLTITLFMSCKLSKIAAPIYPVAIF